jgi:hypothetical protein
VRAHLPDVERAEQLVDAAVDRIHLLAVQQPPRDPGLVGDDPDGDPRGAQQGQRGAGGRNRGDELRVAAVRDVNDESAVAVEEHRRGRRIPQCARRGVGEHALRCPGHRWGKPGSPNCYSPLQVLLSVTIRR